MLGVTSWVESMDKVADEYKRAATLIVDGALCVSQPMNTEGCACKALVKDLALRMMKEIQVLACARTMRNRSACRSKFYGDRVSCMAIRFV